MDYDQLYTFITIVQTKNYSEAAKILNVTQPTVTARIRKLEEEIGCSLFERTGKTINLSPKGIVFSQYAAKTLSFMDEAKRNLQISNAPGLKIGFSSIFPNNTILSIVDKLKEQTDLPVHNIEVYDSNTLSNKLLNEHLDVVFLLNPIVHNSQIMMEYLFEERFAFIIGKNHRLSNKEVIKPEDLKGELMINFRRRTQLSIEVDERLLEVDNLKRIEVNSVDILKRMISKNYGFSIISALAIDNEDRNSILIKDFTEIQNIKTKVYALSLVLH